jgi:uncharacterized protein
MSTRDTPWPEGTPAWVDLAVPDRDAALEFYRQVMDWEYVINGPEYGNYAIATVDGRAAAGIGPTPPGAEGAPPTWTTYLASDDVDATCEKIAASGGSVMFGPDDVGEQGRMAIAADPTGGVFGVWQAGTTFGAAVVNQPGAVAWNDLSSRDATVARQFYSAVFGYEYTPIEGAEDYSTINGGGPGGMIGGIGQLPSDAPAGVPSHWTTYFSVADVDDAVKRVTEAGGTVEEPPQDTPYGRLASCRDPFGAAFTLGSGGDPE